MEKKLSVGLIGAMGRGAFIGRLFNESGRALVTAVADINPAAFEVGRQRYTACGADPRLYADAGEMLAREELDWVVVGTPDRTHHALAKQAIEAGRNVFVEKPMTQTTVEADDLCRLVARFGVKLVVGYELRFSPAVEVFRKALREGRIGRPVIGAFVDHVGAGYSYYLRDHRKKLWGRGLLMQKGVHSLDLMNDSADAEPVRAYGTGGRDYFGGRPEAEGLYCRDCKELETCPYSFRTISSDQWKKHGPREKGEHAFDHCVFKPDSDAEDNMHLVVDYANGFRFAYTAVYFAPKYEREWTVWGTEGSLQAETGRPWVEFRRLGGGGREERLPVAGDSSGGHGGGDARFIGAVVQSTFERTPLHPDVLDGRGATAAAEYGQRSIEMRQALDIPPAPR